MPQEEGSYEYASDHGGSGKEGEAHLESGVLYQPLSGNSEGSSSLGSVVPRCEAGSERPCDRPASGFRCLGPSGHPAPCTAAQERHKPSRREIEKVEGEEKKIEHALGCGALVIGVGVFTDGLGAPTATGVLCDLL